MMMFMGSATREAEPENKMAIVHQNKEAAQSVADAFNAQFLGAGYAVTYIGQAYAKAMGVARGGFYVANPWGKLV